MKIPLKRPGGQGSQNTYAEAGVDIGAGRRAVDLFKEQVRSTFRPEVVGDVGGFGGAFAFDKSVYKDPLLVSGTDGVGTKVMIAQMLGIHDSIGIDLVAMSVNDIAAHGAEPLFFLDYIVIDKVDPDLIHQIVKGVAEGCRSAGCALLGGEVAEHPGHMFEGSYDLAGFCVGVVERERLVTGAQITPGDVIVGIASSGLHSNGFSLVRRILLGQMQLKLDDRPMGLESTLAEELLRPTLIYWPAVAAVAAQEGLRGIAHITGGGMPENIGRILPDGTAAVIDASAWEAPPIFGLISSLGHVETDEMHSTFNMGIGMALVVSAEAANHTLDAVRARGFDAFEIGAITESSPSTPKVHIT